MSSLVVGTCVVDKPLPASVIHPDYPQNPRSLGQKLRKIRLDLRLQISQVAEATGTSEKTITNWERYGMTPSPRLLEGIREFYRAQGHPLADRL